MSDTVVIEGLAGLPPHLSYSSFTSWLHCGKQYELEKIQRVTRMPAWYLVGGNVFHEWSEIHDRGDIEPPPITRMFLEAVTTEEEESGFDRKYWKAGGRKSKEYPGKESEIWWLDKLPEMAAKFVAWRKEHEHKIWVTHEEALGIELKLEFMLGEILIKAALDRAYLLKNGDLALVDVKTGRIPETSLQLGVYKVGVQKQYGETARWASFYGARDGKHTPWADLTLWTPAVLAELFRQFSVAIKNEIFIPNLGGHCRQCSVSHACVLGGGGDTADANDSLAPLTQVRF